jgi:drug/metabolite transporter (DMT)-like permease
MPSRAVARRGIGSAAAPVAFVVIWSGGFTFVEIGLRWAAPITLLAIRYLAVLAVLVPIFAVMRPPLPRRRADWGHLAAVGLLIQVLYFTLTRISLGSGTPAGEVALIVALQPLLVALLAGWVANEPTGIRRWAGLALGLAGAVIVIVSRSALGPASIVGILGAVGALFAMGAGTLYEKRFGGDHHPVSANLVQYAVAVAVTVPVAALLEGFRVTWSMDLAGALGYLVLGNSLISMTLLLAMIRRGEAARVSALFFLVPPVAALFAWVVLRESLPAVTWVGMIVSVAGVALASLRQRVPV